ncbi:MAG: Bestrophin, RFP-TM, chloride channel-domain-containing protein [Monoraphidium minutum]|nr:MAG: Bestrophin, RFP-TM, chloride channel-domain-containing protein [Monoraphidium minutum]
MHAGQQRLQRPCGGAARPLPLHRCARVARPVASPAPAPGPDSSARGGAAPARGAPPPCRAAPPVSGFVRRFWDDDGSEGSGLQHGGRSNAAWNGTEESRAYRRTSFTWRDWRKHRSNRRFYYHLSTLHRSRIVRSLLRPVFVITAAAAAVCAYHTAFNLGLLPRPMPALPLVPIEPFQLSSFALALLLVFRTNAAYQRWHEARAKFGLIADSARDVWRQVLAVFPRERPEARAMVGRWLVAYIFTCKWALREEGRLRSDLEGWLEPRELDTLPRELDTLPRELDTLMSIRDPPHYCMLVLSHVLRDNLVGLQLVKLMDVIGSMMYSLSSCNRILTTPIPLSYTRHTTRFMALWLLLLPLALYAKCGWGCVPAAALVSLALLTIEAIGVSLEEPFSILALEHICERLAASIAAFAAMDEDAQRSAALYSSTPLLDYPAAAAAAAGPSAGASPRSRSPAPGRGGGGGSASGTSGGGGGAPAAAAAVAVALEAAKGHLEAGGGGGGGGARDGGAAAEALRPAPAAAAAQGSTVSDSEDEAEAAAAAAGGAEVVESALR